MVVPGYMNLYVHFPFCRAKCAYCALHSRAGSTLEARRAYCARLAAELATWGTVPRIPGTDPEKAGTVPTLSTIYFGGGSPALCDLSPLFTALRKWGTDPSFWGTVPTFSGSVPGMRGSVPHVAISAARREQ